MHGTEINMKDGSGESLDDLVTTVALSHECKLREAHLLQTNNEITKLQQEVSKLRLERDWCFDKDKKLIVSTPEDQATEICMELISHPHLLEDTVKTLRGKRADLLYSLKDLESRCEQIKEEIKQL
jgi:hypothetical protein